MGRPAILKIDILADGKTARAELNRTGDAGKKIGKAVAAGAAIAVTAVAGIALAAAKSASDVEQAVGASEKVFDRYAGAVQKRAAQADRALGLSKSAYLDLANVIGTQLKNAGTPMAKLGGETDKLITKGADLAATFGGSTADAVSALSSAMKGELDPIEKYGVSIKQSDVNARLAEQGLDKLTGAAAKTAQQQALLALINEQTAATTGAFADESNTAAGVGARASAVWENMKATLGAGLLPILVAVGTFFLDKMAPAISSVAAQLSTNAGPAFTRLGTFITTRVVPAAQKLFQWFMQKIVPGFRQFVTPIVAALRDRMQVLSAAIDRNRPAIDKVISAARKLAEWFASKVLPVAGKVIAVFLRMQSGAFSVVIDALGAMVNGISSAVSWFQRLIDKIGALASKVSNSGVGKFLSGVGSALFGSATITPRGVVGARLTPSSASAAGVAPAGSLSLLPSVNVEPPQVQVFIGEREVTELVRVVVAKDRRQQARRALLVNGV